MSYRIIIQEIKKRKFKHIKQYTLDTLEDTHLIENFLGYLKYCERKSRDYHEKQLKKYEKEFFESDLWDKKSVGKDISNKEFLENEKFFDTYY